MADLDKNPLLRNMVNKVESIERAIEMCYTMANGKSIDLGGRIGEVKAKEGHQDALIKRADELFEERDKLARRCERLGYYF